MSDAKKVFDVIFNIEESICTAFGPYGTAVHPQNWPLESAVYFSINPLHTRRLDANVTCYRNILIEMDKVSLDKQLEIIKEIPLTSVTYSGGKSYHCIISLVEPCETREEYDALVSRIYTKVPEADRSARNPSRFSRVPGALRDGVTEQKLYSLKSRVPKATIEAWLGPAPVEAPKVREPYPDFLQKRKEFLRDDTGYFLAFGAQDGKWNSSLFKAACDMTRAEFELQDIVEACAAITGKLDSRDLATIRSAYRSAKNGI
jgi:hypothetical protein